MSNTLPDDTRLQCQIGTEKYPGITSFEQRTNAEMCNTGMQYRYEMCDV